MIKEAFFCSREIYSFIMKLVLIKIKLQCCINLIDWSLTF